MGVYNFEKRFFNLLDYEGRSRFFFGWDTLFSAIEPVLNKLPKETLKEIVAAMHKGQHELNPEKRDYESVHSNLTDEDKVEVFSRRN